MFEIIGFLILCLFNLGGYFVWFVFTAFGGCDISAIGGVKNWSFAIVALCGLFYWSYLLKVNSPFSIVVG